MVTLLCCTLCGADLSAWSGMLDPMMTDPGAQHLAAIADARPNAYGDECGASGPGGECCRIRGHFDTDDFGNVMIHVSYDTDHYKDWPVGWKSQSEKVKAINDPHFASALTGNADYRRGVEDALKLVRDTLQP